MENKSPIPIIGERKTQEPQNANLDPRIIKNFQMFNIHLHNLDNTLSTIIEAMRLQLGMSRKEFSVHISQIQDALTMEVFKRDTSKADVVLNPTIITLEM